MRQRRATPPLSPQAKLLSAVGVLAAGGLITFAGLSYFGLLSRPAAAQPDVQRPKSREGLVAVPRSLRNVKAFSKVTREDVYNLKQGDDSYFWMAGDRVEANPRWIRDVSKIVGRVMARDKESGFVFTESDFLPEGSRAGLSGGVPEGKQGFFLDAEQVPGLRLLRKGDRFDLLARLPEEVQAEAEAEFGLLAGGVKARAGKPIPLSGVRLLVQSGEVIALTAGRAVSTTGIEGLPEEPTTRSRTRDSDVQATIAIDQEEVVTLTQALAEGLTIHCVARSGRNTDDSDKTLQNALSQMQPIPATSRPLQAYSRITPEDLAEARTGELRRYYFKPAEVDPDWVDSLDNLLGRVVSRDIGAGHIFTEADLLPVGSPAGVVGATPPGKVSLPLPATSIRGAENLRRGDHFALIASRSTDLRDRFGTSRSVSFQGAGVGGGAIRVYNTVLVQDGVVVDQRAEDDTLTVAIAPNEVSALTKSIGGNDPLFAIAQPPRDGNTTPIQAQQNLLLLESDPDPIESVTAIETIVGDRRATTLFNRSSRE